MAGCKYEDRHVDMIVMQVQDRRMHVRFDPDARGTADGSKERRSTWQSPCTGTDRRRS